MMIMIAASLAAAAPAAPAQPMDAHARQGFAVTPRQILGALARAADEQGLPHPVHLHGQMADMKDCCCKDMMDKMHGEHVGHEDHGHQ